MEARVCVLFAECLQVAYAIGVAKPLSVYLDTYGTGTKTDAEILSIVNANFDLRPGVLRRELQLTRPVYEKVLDFCCLFFFPSLMCAADCLLGTLRTQRP